MLDNIKMVDLRGQYDKIKPEVDLAIQNVVDSTAFIQGEAVKKFAQNLERFLQVKHVIPCANGTDALQIALMALGLKPGDEVVTSNFTFAATVEVIALLGLKPILVDIDPRTFNIDVSLIERAITPKTKAIIPVHLFGQCSDMEPIMALAKERDLYVIEDTAQAIGAEYTFQNGISNKAGTIGDFGTTSFFPSKNLGCFGDGGAIFTNDDSLAEITRGIVNHGMYTRYYHDRVGVNSRLDTIQAAVLDIKLKHLESYNEARQKAAQFYNKGFQLCEKIITPFKAENSTHVYHQYTLQLDKSIDRNLVQKQLADNKIPAMIYYPVPLHSQKAYHSTDFSDANYPVTINLSETVLSLPMHTELTVEQQAFIIEQLTKYI